MMVEGERSFGPPDADEANGGPPCRPPSTAMIPHPERMKLWPLDTGRYGLDVTFAGNWGCEDAEQEAAQLSRRGMPNVIRQEPDGEWTVRLGPLHSLDVARALSSLMR